MLSVHRKVWFLVLLYHLLSWKHTTAVKIINTFGNGVQSYGLSRDRDFGTVSQDPLSNLPAKITICASLKTNDGPNILGFYQLLNDEGLPVLSTQLFNFKRSSRQSIKFVGAVKDPVSVSEIPIIPMQRFWVHTCTSFDSTTGHAVVVANGEAIIDANISPVNLPSSLTNNLVFGNLWIGMWYTSRGSVANLNVYSRQLSEAEMIDKTSGAGCGLPDGDYLSWSDIQLRLEGAALWDSVSAAELCQKESSMVVFTEIMLAGDCMNLCPKMLRGHAPPVVTPEQQLSVHDLVKGISFIDRVGPGPMTKSGRHTSATWLPIKRVGNKWVDWFDHSVAIINPPWSTGQPENGQNCALYTAEVDKWYSSNCNVYGNAVAICPCHFTEQPLLNLRGLCGDSNLDKILMPQNQFTDGLTSFYGLLKTELTLKDNVWTLNVFNSTTMAYTQEAPANGFALGKYDWNIEGDHINCNQGKPYSKTLKLTGCQEGEFTCSEGQCITMEQRCNQISNCRDESDEEGCQLMVVKPSYNKKVPPISIKNDEVVPVEVNVTIALMKITDIIETKHKIVLQFGIKLKWYENRAQFHNLKKESTLNALNDMEIEDMWLPFIIYDNTDQKEAVRLHEDVKTTVTVNRAGGFVRSGVDEADEIEIFEGNPKSSLGGNYVEMRQTYSKEFQCEYQLHRYPFDIQVCSIDLGVMELEQRTIQLIPEEVIMTSKKELTMYIITQYSIQYRNISDSKAGIQMQITLKRRIVNEMLTTYLPSVLLILITYATTFFKAYYFEAAMTGNLTTMLVTTTIFVAVMDKLPATAYVKFVDIWLILGQLIPFTEVCLLTALELFRDGDGDGLKTINHHGKPKTVNTITPGEVRLSSEEVIKTLNDFQRIGPCSMG